MLKKWWGLAPFVLNDEPPLLNLTCVVTNEAARKVSLASQIYPEYENVNEDWLALENLLLPLYQKLNACSLFQINFIHLKFK